jgi:hypothetical protein
MFKYLFMRLSLVLVNFKLTYVYAVHYGYITRLGKQKKPLMMSSNVLSNVG